MQKKPRNNHHCKQCGKTGRMICLPVRVGFKIKRNYIHKECAKAFLAKNNG